LFLSAHSTGVLSDVDLVDEIDPDIRESALGMAMELRGCRSSVLMTSTWHWLGGPMSSLLISSTPYWQCSQPTQPWLGR
jgi:hypothetical protein